jgi:hypothetical protein
LARSAASARSRASWRLYSRFRLRVEPRNRGAALRGRPRGRSRSGELAVRARCGGAGGSGSALRSSGASTAARICAAVFRLQIEGGEIGEDVAEVGGREHWRISCGGIADDSAGEGAELGSIGGTLTQRHAVTQSLMISHR